MREVIDVPELEPCLHAAQGVALRVAPEGRVKQLDEIAVGFDIGLCRDARRIVFEPRE
jgi:hypothetical protein